MDNILKKHPSSIVPPQFCIGEKGRRKKWCKHLLGIEKELRRNIRKKAYQEWVKAQQEKRRTNAV